MENLNDPSLTQDPKPVLAYQSAASENRGLRAGDVAVATIACFVAIGMFGAAIAALFGACAGEGVQAHRGLMLALGPFVGFVILFELAMRFTAMAIALFHGINTRPKGSRDLGVPKDSIGPISLMVVGLGLLIVLAVHALRLVSKYAGKDEMQAFFLIAVPATIIAAVCVRYGWVRLRKGKLKNDVA